MGIGKEQLNRYDPDGEFWNNVIGAVVGGGVEYVSQVVGNIAVDGGKITSETFTNVDLLDIGIAAVEGALTSGGSAIKNAATKTTIKVVSTVTKNAVDVENKNGKVESTVNSLEKTVKTTAIDAVGAGAGKAVPKSTKVVKQTSNTKAVNAARQKAAEKGEKLTPKQANEARANNKKNNAEKRATAKTVSEIPEKTFEPAVEVTKRGTTSEKTEENKKTENENKD